MRAERPWRRRGELLWLAALALPACERAKPLPNTPSATATNTPSGERAATGAASASAASKLAASSPNAAAASANVASAPPLELETRLVRDLKPGERRPLVVFLHGLGASASVAFQVMPLEALGTRDRVHVIAPNGTFDSAKRRFWNAGKACCNFDHLDIDDVSRLGALLDTWSARPDVDPSRVYMMGYSNGGFMTHRLACERGSRLAAVAVLAGAVETPGACPTQPALSVFMAHGDADDAVPYAGGRVFDSPSLGPHLSALESFREWGKRLACDHERPGKALDLDPKLPGAETSSLGFARCQYGDAALLSVHGGTHYVGSRQGVVEAAWTFLLSHRKR